MLRGPARFQHQPTEETTPLAPLRHWDVGTPLPVSVVGDTVTLSQSTLRVRVSCYSGVSFLPSARFVGPAFEERSLLRCHSGPTSGASAVTICPRPRGCFKRQFTVGTTVDPTVKNERRGHFQSVSKSSLFFPNRHWCAFLHAMANLSH